MWLLLYVESNCEVANKIDSYLILSYTTILLWSAGYRMSRAQCTLYCKPYLTMFEVWSMIMIINLVLSDISCSSSGFPFVWVRLVYSYHSAVRLYLCKKNPCCCFLSTFLPPLTFSFLSSHNPPVLAVVFLFLQHSCFFVSDLFGNLSSFILTMCQTLTRFLTILPTVQASDPTSPLRSFILRLSTLFTPAILLIH